MRIKTLFLVVLSSCFLAPLSACRASPPPRTFDEIIDSPMYTDPDFPLPRRVMVFSDEAKGLWLRALERPEADLRCKAAEAIALAHQRGMEGLETTVGPLVQALD